MQNATLDKHVYTKTLPFQFLKLCFITSTDEKANYIVQYKKPVNVKNVKPNVRNFIDNLFSRYGSFIANFLRSSGVGYTYVTNNSIRSSMVRSMPYTGIYTELGPEKNKIFDETFYAKNIEYTSEIKKYPQNLVFLILGYLLLIIEIILIIFLFFKKLIY